MLYMCSTYMYTHTICTDIIALPPTVYNCVLSLLCSEGCIYLEYVDLSYCAVTNEGIKALATKCLRLKHILAKYCREVSFSL